MHSHKETVKLVVVHLVVHIHEPDINLGGKTHKKSNSRIYKFVPDRNKRLFSIIAGFRDATSGGPDKKILSGAFCFKTWLEEF